MASGYIKIDKPFPEVLQSVTQRFETRPYNQLISEETEMPSRYKIKCVFLYATTGCKKINYFKPARHTFKTKHQEVNNYDRFIVLGVEGTNHVLLTFTQSSLESRRILCYSQSMEPGTAVWVLCPKVIGYLKATQNPLIRIGDPLIPTARDVVYKLPPVDVNVPNYVFFDFIPTNYRLIQALPKDNVCSGKVCDGQTSNPCPCIVAESKKHWALTFRFTCNELSERVTGEKSVEITSTALTKRFIHPNKRTEQLSSDNLDTFEMEDAVIQLLRDIVTNQGVRLIGWFKPAIDEEGVASGTFSYHISTILPVLPLTEAQNALLYGHVNQCNANNGQ